MEGLVQRGSREIDLKLTLPLLVLAVFALLAVACGEGSQPGARRRGSLPPTPI